MVDGVFGNEVSGQNRMASQINLDAIGEIKVQPRLLQAEFRPRRRRNIQVVSKGGGTDYSGSAYYSAGATPGCQHLQNNRTNVARGKYVFDTYGFTSAARSASRLIDHKATRSCSSSTRSRTRA